MITKAIYETLSTDTTLAGLLSNYGRDPAIFTVDPAPEDAAFPYIVAAGSPVQIPYDTKLTRGRQIWRDIRCYSDISGSAEEVETIAERVRALLHRKTIDTVDYSTIWAECDGPTVADDGNSYGRIVTLKITIQDN